jgi:NAD-dependent SIR2 family protein deacetylase
VDASVGSLGLATPAVNTDLLAMLRMGRVAVLCGAGVSTGSGIPDYRGPSGLARSAKPMTYQDFTGSPAARQRYWARSYVGWKVITGAQPNDAHRAITAIQSKGFISGVVTQNVDGLHHAAGTQDVIELHGALSRVVCLRCGEVTDRPQLDRRLAEVNPSWVGRVGELKPDGDVDVGDVSDFRVVDCESCDGLLKPDVVFFGETVPRGRVDQAFDLVSGANSLLVLGSSLTVMSGYRFVLHAKKLGLPIAIVNQGATRGDAHAHVVVDADLSSTLTALTVELAR